MKPLELASPRRVFIAGVSTRAAAESAARAGFEVHAFDAFGDLDQHPAVHARSLPRDLGVPFSADAAARLSRSVPCDAVVYLSNFENHPRAVAQLAAGRALWGNGPTVLRRARHPRRLSEILRARGVTAPAVYAGSGWRSSIAASGARGQRLLLKPVASGGGHHIRLWPHADEAPDRLPPGTYLQEFVEGTPASVIFVAAQGRVSVLGMSRQLCGDPAFGADGYRYCGSILCSADDPVLPGGRGLRDAAGQLAAVVSEALGLVGLNGIDVIAREGVPWPIEVNPRWCASMELVERRGGPVLFGLHVAACVSGSLPPVTSLDVAADDTSSRPPVESLHMPALAPAAHAFARVAPQRSHSVPAAMGKAIVFARTGVIAGDTSAWLGNPDVRDIPVSGVYIPAGGPICTVFAEEVDGRACYEALVGRARRIHADVARWAERGGGSRQP